jgi:ribose 5-phosphate isomerase B
VRIVIASDHAGFRYKNLIRDALRQQGYDVTDFGTNSPNPVDYPVVIRPAAEAVARGEFDRGIILGGSGNGEAIVANRVRGVRAAVCWNTESARLGRAHNNANVLSLGERLVTEEEALAIVDIYLNTSFDGGRHLKRIQQIDQNEPKA